MSLLLLTIVRLSRLSFLLCSMSNGTALFQSQSPNCADQDCDLWQWLLQVISPAFCSHRFLFTVGTSLLHIVIYWSYNYFMSICYRYDLFATKRLGKRSTANKALVNDANKRALFSHLVAQPLVLYLLTYPCFSFCGIQFQSRVPSLAVCCRDVAVSYFLNDTLFYWAHRALHHPAIYKYVHKEHHLFQDSVADATEFVHPLEDLIAFLAFSAGCLLLKSHVVVFWIWMTIRLLETLDAHCGFAFDWSPFSCFPFQSGSERHYYHHSHNLGCFSSSTMIWDRLMGTDKDFLAFKEQGARKEAAMKKSL